MAKVASPALKAALCRERRTNRRLRAFLEQTTEQIRLLRRDFELQFTRIAQLQVEMDRGRAERRPLLERRGLEEGGGFAAGGRGLGPASDTAR